MTDPPAPAVTAVKDAMMRGGWGSSHSWLVGEPCFDPPDALRRAYVVGAQTQGFHYGPPGGLAELRTVLAKERWCGAAGATAANLTITHGAKSAVLLVLATLLEAGDEVLCPVPCFPSYAQQVAAVGGRFVPVPWNPEDGESLDAAIAARVSQRSRILVLSSPCNPSGRVLDLATAEAVVELCRQRGMIVISDEVYEAFRYRDDLPPTVAVTDPDREVVVQVRSVSKTLALCGWRIGFVVSSSRLATRLAARQSALLNPPSTPAQQALLHLDEVPTEFQESARRAVRRRCREAADALRAAGFCPVEPDGGFYLWLDIRSSTRSCGLASSAAWCEAFARECGHALWPGEDFLGTGWARLSVVTPRDDQWGRAVVDLERSLQRFAAARAGQSSASPAPKKFTPS